ncbi:Rieske (2Fe-2S) protein [Streptantibioticus ferralitis]|uniref:Cytochrome bc1 complex Rieske iron-sulfur subunit n=1 Tax=Streptantibioticus ferralitis TaxID=236510 RepID=A0ABT5YZX1_9ACTN|nr:Rieske 2Fe-2S domain-containing protein [Streptantibioticus ferralitis]MDF2256967.1 Rieske 2Fe-2S domain-containing protein [Streptantibioticus ferralitis]
MTEQPTCRRTLLQGAALAGVAGIGLTACGGGGTSSATPSSPTDLGAADQIPVGGAKLFRDDKVVVAQPSKGTYKGFSAVCTHAGCVVDNVEGAVISCPCHGSRFNALTGAVEQGPAGAPLAEVPVRIQGGKIITG